MDIARNIKRRRLELGISQQELAASLGYRSRSSIAKIESGRADVPLSKLMDLASALDTTIEALLSGASGYPAPVDLARSGNREDRRVAAIMLAGGRSSRNQRNIPNQFVNVLGKPVIVYCLETYQAHPLIEDVFIVCPEEWREIAAAYSEQFGISKLRATVPSGESGVLSVRRGLDCVLANGYGYDDIVVIQEATRPLVSPETVSKLLAACIADRSAIIGERMADYVQFETASGRTDYVDRNSLVSLQSPEAYEVGMLQEAFSEVGRHGEALAESCMGLFLARLGRNLNFCMGERNNIKIIRQEDLAIFTALLKQRL